MRPSASLLAQLSSELVRHPPFDRMERAALDFFLTRSHQLYFAPGEVLLEPASGPVQHLFYIRQGAVSGVRGLADLSAGAFEYEAGDLFPAGAALAQRAVTARYSATQDTFVLALPLPAMRELVALSPPFSDFLNRRFLKFLELSADALQADYSSRVLAEQSLETPLGQVVRTMAVTCAPETSLRTVLGDMHKRRIGSMLVADAQGVPLGILTRHDVLDRITLPGVSLDTPVSAVMSQPLYTLTHEHTAQDAALLMSTHGIRHVPVLRDGVLTGIVSERDLFAMQRMSVKHVSIAIRSAPDVEALRRGAQEIRRFARSLLGQGVSARHLTGLISHLNDVLTQRLLDIEARRHGVDIGRLCWLALGSEGRGEQTIATDQDNALILPDGTSAAQREQILAFANAVNLGLDACGYPLCKGGIMAGQPSCCKTLGEWRDAFAGWIDHGAPQDLLDASIYFDFRPLAGDAALAGGLREEVVQAASRTPRFLKQMADNALSRSVPLDWRGAIATDDLGGVDLKLQGAAIFVDVARLYSLANAIASVGTRERLEAVGTALGVPAAESQTWVGAFEFLQMLRLRMQLDGGALTEQPNRVRLAELNDLDRRILKESFRVARTLQQRMRLDYER
jgi:CBS domain-containing protein